MEGSCPVISFDFFYTKAGDEAAKDEDTLVSMIMVEKDWVFGCCAIELKGTIRPSHQGAGSFLCFAWLQ